MYKVPDSSLIKKHFIVKIQVPLTEISQGEKSDCDKLDPHTITVIDGGLMVYNEDRSIEGHLLTVGHAEQKEVHGLLVKTIKERGASQGTKGFFYAIYKKTTNVEGGEGARIELEINPEVLLPVETW